MKTLLVEFALSFAVLLAAIAGMAIGVMNGRPAIRGSCGGLNGKACGVCTAGCAGRQHGEARHHEP